jgi:curved DNA-binding protein CbpA
MLTKILTLVCILALVSAKPEYYSILELPRGASIDQIKKSFKKLAVKYHPDKAATHLKEEYQKRFSDISDAYTTLSDPEVKNVYDRSGHAGLEQLRNQKDWQNQQRAQQEMFNNQVVDHFQGTDVQILNIESLSKFYRRNGVWVVLFYKSTDQELRQGLKQAMMEINQMYYGVFTVAAVNCDIDESICDEYHISETPTLLGFTSEFNHEGKKFTDLIALVKVAPFAVSLMENYVSVVTSGNVEEFLEERGKVKLLFFSSKKEANPVFKALSKEFRSSVEIGHVKDEGNTLRRRFNLMNGPSVVLLKGDAQIQYQGALNIKNLSEFIREHRYPDGMKVNKKGKVFTAESAADLDRNGCSKTSKKICILALYEDEQERKAMMSELEQAIQGLKEDPTIIQVSNRRLINLQQLGMGAKTRYILFKPNKARVMSQEDEKFNLRRLMDLIDNAVGGSAVFSTLRGELIDQARTDL